MLRTPTKSTSPTQNEVGSIQQQDIASNRYDGTPVGDQDRKPKIQLCVELRNKIVITSDSRRSSRPKDPVLVLEVSVLFIKNLRRGKRLRGSAQPTFVKISLIPGRQIYSTELRMNKTNEEMVDFIEVFDFPLENEQDLVGKKIEVLVCDKKMTRNAATYGKVVIDVGNLTIKNPICDWHNLKSSSERNNDSLLASP